jgi:hypothetical protein
MIVSFVQYLFSYNGENVRFVMHVPEVLWFTISKFLMSVSSNKTLMWHLARKDLWFKKAVNFNAVVCVILNYFTKFAKIRVSKSDIRVYEYPLLCHTRIARNVLTSMHIVSRLLTATSGFCILVGLEASFVFLFYNVFIVRVTEWKKPEHKNPLIFEWMEANMHHPAVDFN